MTPNPHRGGEVHLQRGIVNDTEPAQRGGGSFTEGRSRWELALNSQPLTLTQNIQSGRAEPCPIVPRARETIHRRTRLFHRQREERATITHPMRLPSRRSGPARIHKLARGNARPCGSFVPGSRFLFPRGVILDLIDQGLQVVCGQWTTTNSSTWE